MSRKKKSKKLDPFYGNNHPCNLIDENNSIKKLKIIYFFQGSLKGEYIISIGDTTHDRRGISLDHYLPKDSASHGLLPRSMSRIKIAPIIPSAKIDMHLLLNLEETPTISSFFDVNEKENTATSIFMFASDDNRDETPEIEEALGHLSKLFAKICWVNQQGLVQFSFGGELGYFCNFPTGLFLIMNERLDQVNK
ncbi:MAG: hypothetical protein F6K63_29885 [Moorea sp. SIO1G6]|uniref:hypothetical protein n=1 Tax=Moorena sp. SIO1G6 TaxID=2607840 RepID=UPI0013C24BB5|nr:hypothetical protein [Moorena sp. SIO1G6]NET68381.1 hypothetical protein [Moorena sp. SIO1G6]